MKVVLGSSWSSPDGPLALKFAYNKELASLMGNHIEFDDMHMRAKRLVAMIYNAPISKRLPMKLAAYNASDDAAYWHRQPSEVVKG